MRNDIAAAPKFRPILTCSIAIAVLVLSAPFSNVYAQLSGSTVNLSAYYPDDSSLFSNPGDTIVSDAIEYPAGSFAPYHASWEADVNQSQVIIRWTFSINGEGDPAEFNGFIFDVLSGPEIVSATVNPSSQFVPFSVTLDGSRRLLLNYQSVAIPPGPSFSTIDLHFVPEPTAIVLLATGGLAIFGFRRR